MKEPSVSLSVDGKVALNEDQVMALFIPNHLTKEDRGYDGKIFETFGVELEFVRSLPSDRVATLLDADGSICIGHGFHFVNRLGYFVGADVLPDFGSLCVLEDEDEEDAGGEEGGE